MFFNTNLHIDYIYTHTYLHTYIRTHTQFIFKIEMFLFITQSKPYYLTALTIYYYYRYYVYSVFKDESIVMELTLLNGRKLSAHRLFASMFTIFAFQSSLRD